MYEVAIVGYGPAAITAGIYIARKRLNTILIGEVPGGEVVNSGEIENWPGDSNTDGATLSQKMVNHLKQHENQIDIVQDKVTTITKENGLFNLTVKNNEPVQAKTVIYATGRHPRPLKVEGEEELKNRGVSYCATCDAPIFSDKNVAVIGGGNTGAEAVIMLQKIAKKIFLLHLDDKLAADQVLVDAFQDDAKVQIILNAKTTKIEGETTVQSLEYENTQTGEKNTIPLEGIFVTIGTIPNTDPVKDLVELDKYGAIKADRYGKTTMEGFFAAGDVTDIRDAQIVVAAGHACSAALSAGDYLVRN